MLTLSIAGRPIEGYMATGLKMLVKDMKLKNSLPDEFFGEDITGKNRLSLQVEILSNPFVFSLLPLPPSRTKFNGVECVQANLTILVIVIAQPTYQQTSKGCKNLKIFHPKKTLWQRMGEAVAGVL